MKSLRLLALLAAFVPLAVASAPAHASEADDAIVSTARGLYVFKTYLKGDDITIASKDGVVTLTGTVTEEPRKLLAQETVASLRGVTGVDNRLTIKGDPPAANSDAWIEARVKTVLFFHHSVSGLKTEVNATAGVVTLRGEAANLAQKELTTEYARDVAGVRDVNNLMTVAATPGAVKETVGERIDDASITAQVKLSLLFHRSTSALKTQVDTADGVVTLSGMAGNAAERDLVGKLAGDVGGVTTVNNRMTVEEPKVR